MGHKRALISVSERKGIAEFSKGLISSGYEIIATDGTHRFLEENGVSSVTVEEVTGLKSTARVKTLHPAIYKPILEGGEDPINLVVCNLYPFEKNLDKNLSELIELIDIGGVSLIRAAAKNYNQVVVVVDPDDYNSVLDGLHNDGVAIDQRRQLAKKAFSYVAYYDSIITRKFGEDFDSRQALPLVLVRSLPYGENPHQRAWFFLGDDEAESIRILQGKGLSYNNYLDAHTAYGAALEFERPCCVIVKHTSPCGVGVDDSVVDAYTKAQMSDQVSVFGGVVGFNCPVDEATAQRMSETFLELVVAPSFSDSALEVFKTKKRLRILSCPRGILKKKSIKTALGGYLIQDRDFDYSTDWQCVTDQSPSNYDDETLKFAWRVCKWVKSNAIVLAIKDRTVGIGGGQPSRVGAVEIALKKAGVHPIGMVLASDGFIPFRDSIDLIAQAGVGAVIQPGGSIKDDEVIQACNEHGIAMVFTRRRHFRH